MKRWIWFLVLPLALTAAPDWFGYYESEADIMQLQHQTYAFGYNKFRLDLEARPSDNVLIGVNLNIQKYWGQTTWNLLDFLPKRVWEPVFHNPDWPSEYWVNEQPVTIPDTLLWDNYYLRLSLARLDLTVGRQQISPGVGYAWNPTDIFNSKTLLDPSYEQTGVNVIRGEFTLGNRLTLDAVVQPADTWANSTRQLFIKTGLGSFDVTLTQAEYSWERTRLLNGVPVPLSNQRQLSGASMVGELLGWGVWAEGARNLISDDNDFNETVLGVDHTFDNSLYILIEGLHNESGIANTSNLTFQDYLRSYNGETHSLMQNYGFVYLNHPTFDLVSLSTIILANFDDHSGTVAPQLDWSIFEDTKLSFQGSWFWGPQDSEFGLQDWALRLRVLSSF